MAAVTPPDPRLQSALAGCVTTLQRLANYELPPSLQRRLRDLGERKEFLDETQHDELLALADFAQQRTLEKLEARVALQRLAECFPEGVQAA